ncbi:MAG: KEOPS complex subunit Cgi121 [Candidatus Bathyarchaeia archaeon]
MTRLRREGRTIRVERIEEYGRCLGIAGFREAQITGVPTFLEAVREKIGHHVFQLLNADHVAGWEHLYFAALNALKAFQDGGNIAERLDIEILLYSSCQDQIVKAFTLIGVTPQTSRVALLTLAESEEAATAAIRRATPLLGVPDDSVLEVNGEKIQRLREVFSISDEELEAVAEPGEERSALKSLLIERCALLAIHR